MKRASVRYLPNSCCQFLFGRCTVLLLTFTSHWAAVRHQYITRWMICGVLGILIVARWRFGITCFHAGELNSLDSSSVNSCCWGHLTLLSLRWADSAFFTPRAGRTLGKPPESAVSSGIVTLMEVSGMTVWPYWRKWWSSESWTLYFPRFPVSFM